MTWLLFALVKSAGAATAAPSCAQAQAVPSPLAQFLTQTITLNKDEISAVAAGTPVVKVLEPSDPLEIAVFGIVRVDVPREFYVRRAADFHSALPSATRIHFGIFSDPASASDVATLSLSPVDVQDLTHCRPGSCNLKLSAEEISQVQAAIRGASTHADSVVNAFFRARIVEYVTAYRAKGDSALIVYDDEPQRTAAARVFAAMLSRSPYMYQYAPSLERYLEQYPQDRPADVREVLFWADDAIPGAKATITIAHEVVYAPTDLPGVTFIATKQLYADHYFDGALSLTAVVDQAGGETGRAGIYVAVLRRAHLDAPPTSGPINLRGKVTRGVRDRTATWLRESKAASEAAYASAPMSAK